MIHHHHHIEEDFYFDGFKGAIDKSGIVHEHDGFRSRIDDIKTYLESCLPGGTKWGPYTDVVPATSPNNKFDSASLLKLIDALTEAFLQHVCLIPTRNPCQNCLLNSILLSTSSAMKLGISSPPRFEITYLMKRWWL